MTTTIKSEESKEIFFPISKAYFADFSVYLQPILEKLPKQNANGRK